MNSSSCARDLRCDGNGSFCLPDGICICDPGWTGIGPYLTITNNKCDVHIDTIKSLSVMEVVLSVTFVVMILRNFSNKFASACSIRNFLIDPKILCGSIFFLSAFFGFLVSLLFLIDARRYVIGQDLLVSVSSTLHVFFCFIGLSLYFEMMLHFLRQSKVLILVGSCQVILPQLTMLRNVSRVIMPLCIPVSLFTIFPFVYRENAKVFAMTGILGVGLLIFMDGVLFVLALRFIVEGLSKHLKKTQISESNAGRGEGSLHMVHRRLSMASHIGIISLFGGSGTMVFFGSWDFLFRKFAYLAVIMRLIGIILFATLYATISGSPVMKPKKFGISLISKFKIKSLYFYRISSTAVLVQRSPSLNASV